MPSSSSSSPIESICIELHDGIIPPSVSLNLSDNEQFGIVQFKTSYQEAIPLETVVLFMVDTSASMNNTCEDGQTQIQHTIYTLTRILLEFAATPCTVYVSVYSFDNSTRCVFDFCEVTNDSIDGLIAKVTAMKADGSTNIELALTTACDVIDDYLLASLSINATAATTASATATATSVDVGRSMEQNKPNRITHVFMTDGQTTSGVTAPHRLKELINHNYSNIFIGFGDDHDANLLSTLASGNNSLGDYRFVDKIENAGYVYGEIIHSILYSVVDNMSITINNGLLYNWVTDSWVTEIDMGTVTSDCVKLIQIKAFTNTHKDITVKLTGQLLPSSIDTVLGTASKSTSMPSDSVDLTKYLFRQYTQQLLFAVRAWINGESTKFTAVDKDNDACDSDTDGDGDGDGDDRHETWKEVVLQERSETKAMLKEQLRHLMIDMLAYMKSSEGMNADALMDMLCDDIFIANQSIDCRNGSMLLTSRLISQGRQTTYTAAPNMDCGSNITHTGRCKSDGCNSFNNSLNPSRSNHKFPKSHFNSMVSSASVSLPTAALHTISCSSSSNSRTGDLLQLNHFIKIGDLKEKFMTSATALSNTPVSTAINPNCCSTRSENGKDDLNPFLNYTISSSKLNGISPAFSSSSVLRLMNRIHSTR